jgi:hypothetical protein
MEWQWDIDLLSVIWCTYWWNVATWIRLWNSVYELGKWGTCRLFLQVEWYQPEPDQVQIFQGWDWYIFQPVLNPLNSSQIHQYKLIQVRCSFSGESYVPLIFSTSPRKRWESMTWWIKWEHQKLFSFFFFVEAPKPLTMTNRSQYFLIFICKSL